MSMAIDAVIALLYRGENVVLLKKIDSRESTLDVMADTCLQRKVRGLQPDF